MTGPRAKTIDNKPCASVVLFKVLSGGVEAEQFENLSTYLTCGPTELKVITACSAETVDGLRRQCKTQRFVTFILSKQIEQRIVTYPRYRDDASRAFIAACLVQPDHKDRVIAIEFSNLGNCIGCEWRERYSARSGKYIGGTPSPYAGVAKTTVPLTRKKVFQFNKWRQEASVTIKDE